MARRAPPAIRHLLAHRTVTLIAALTALLTAALTAAAVSFLAQVTAGAAARELSGKSSSVVTVTAPVSRQSASQVSGDLVGTVRGLLAGLHPRIQVSNQSDPLNVPVRPGRHSGGRLQTQLVTMPAFAAHAEMVSGACRLTGGSAAGLPACVPQAVASELGVRTGSVLTLRDPSGGRTVRVRITGLFRPAQPRSPYWQLDPLGAGSSQRAGSFTTAGPLVTSSAALAGSAVGLSSATVLGQPDLRLLGGTGLGAFGNRLATRVSNLNSAGSHGATISTGLPGQLMAIGAALEVARTRILGSILTLLVAGAVTLAIAARLLTRRRSDETAMLGARGASRTQIARRSLTDAVVVAVPAAVAGPAAGAALLPWLSRAGSWPGGGLTLAGWFAGALVAAAGVAVVGLPWLRRPQSPIRQRSSRGRSIAVAVYARADFIVIVVAAGAVWQLLRSRGPVAVSQSGALSADPILVLAPVLALAGAALLTLRVLPLAARLSDRLAARSRGVTVAAAAWQLSRKALREAGPTLITVLAVAAAVMAIAGRASWQRSVHAQASYQVGADARVTLPSSAALPAGQVAAITGAPGVTASSPAVRESLNLPNSASGNLLALDTKAAAVIIPRAAEGPAPAVLRRLAAAGQAGVPIPGHPSALRFTVRASRSRLGRLSVIASVSDAAGLSYALPAGSVRADGRPHVLQVSIGGHNADYPLRLTGFTVGFSIPRGRMPAQPVTISAAAALSGGAARPRSFPVTMVGSPVRSAASQGTGGTDPAVLAARAQAGSLDFRFSPGVFGAAFRNEGVSAGSAQVTLTDGGPAASQVVPAVVTRSLLAATGMHVGDRMQVTAGSTTFEIMPVAAVRFLPGNGGGPTVLVDQRTLASVLAAAGAALNPVTEWWLRTSGHLRLGSLPAGTSVLTRQRLTSTLQADPLAAAAQQAQLAIAAAAVLLALLALLIGVLTADRSRDLALLDALGMPPGQVARMLAFEQILTGIATAAVGLLVGYLLTRLIVPADTLTAHAARPVPPLAVHVPWPAAAAVAIVIAVVPTVAILLGPRTSRGATVIRTEVPT